MGRDVTITEPELEDGFFPKAPATVCIEGPTQRQCYAAPERYGRHATVAIVDLEKGMPAIFFSVESGGVSGWSVHFALLRPGTGKDLENLFPIETSISNQGQHAFWNDPSLSEAPIFVTATYQYGPGETHYSPHRYTISTWFLETEERYYFLADRYLTVRKYDVDAAEDILAGEKQEILARLRRVKGEAERSPQGPR